MNVLDRLMSLQDLKYRDFTSRLIPNISENRIIGVRMPELRKLAKEMFRDENYREFISSLPHYYQEEYLLHGLIIMQLKDYDLIISELEKLLPYLDNWAVCDVLTLKKIKRNDDLELKVKGWLNSTCTYTIRFGIKCLLDCFLGEKYSFNHLKMVSRIRNEDYYVKMMQAWYYATALIDHYEDVVKLLNSKELDKWVHNKTIQKACESYRISSSKKEYLKELRLG